MKKSVSFWCTAFLAVLLIPYLATIGLNGLETALLNRIPEVENYLPAMLSLEIEDDYEAETLQCQAVIARTNLYRRLNEGENLFDIWAEEGEKIKTIYENEFFPSAFEKLERYERAVSKTSGKVLVYENKLKLVPYHEVSSGTTRDGAEVLHNEEYAYLKSVDSSGDKASPNYLNSSYIAVQQMPENW